MKKLITMILALFALPNAAAATTSPTVQTAHDFTFQTITGKPLPLSDFKGKVVLVVNTASKCGFTGQYKALQELWETYRERRLVVLAVPANDFGSQEPGNNNEIKDFCETTFRITFPIAAKAIITGENAHPFYRWAREQVGWTGSPKWNFHKYLIGPDGSMIDWFSSTTSPDADNLIRAIEAALPPSS